MIPVLQEAIPFLHHGKARRLFLQPNTSRNGATGKNLATFMISGMAAARLTHDPGANKLSSVTVSQP